MVKGDVSNVTSNDLLDLPSDLLLDFGVFGKLINENCSVIGGRVCACHEEGFELVNKVFLCIIIFILFTVWTLFVTPQLVLFEKHIYNSLMAFAVSLSFVAKF
jgi:hypothetical protein